MIPPASGRRLLVISYHFPPDGAVGGLRWAGLTRNLAELGWSSWVVTASQGSTPDVPGVTVVRCPRRTTLNDRYVAMRTRGAPGGRRTSYAATDPTAKLDSGEAVTRPTALQSLRSVVSSAGLMLTLPDVGRGWVLRAASAARRLIHMVKPEVVVTSGPPHSAHVAGRLACMGNGLPRFVDLRDPIITLVYPPLGPIHGPVRRNLERISFGSATAAICVTPESTAELRVRHPRLRVEHVPNGVDLSTLPPAGAAPPFGGLSLVHVGTLYHRRDPRIALRAMHRFLERTPAARSELKLRLVGNVEPRFLDSVTATCRELGLTANVETPGVMSRNDALEIMRRSQVTLIFAQAQIVQIPAKLYEATAIARDVIVITEPDSASGREAVRVGASVAAPDDVDGLSQLLERAWRGERLNDRPTSSAAAIDYRAIAGRYAELLERATPDSAAQHSRGSPSR